MGIFIFLPNLFTRIFKKLIIRNEKTIENKGNTGIKYLPKTESLPKEIWPADQKIILIKIMKLNIMIIGLLVFVKIDNTIDKLIITNVNKPRLL